MAMQGLGNSAQLRLRGHAGGVNWRPTRFVEDVPLGHVCGLCRMIPPRTVHLSCSHVLCESCFEAARMKGANVCPLDREIIGEEECPRIEMPAKKSGSMEAYCWNEENGCKFVGNMTAVLRHYEKKCTFHALPCPRCGARVLHKELPKHYTAGCTTGTSAAYGLQGPFQNAALSLPYATTSLEGLHWILSNGYNNQLSATQSKVIQLVEHSKIHTTQLAEIAARLRNTEMNTEHTLKQVDRINSSPLQQYSQGEERCPCNEAAANGRENDLPVEENHRVREMSDYIGPIIGVFLVIVSAVPGIAFIMGFFVLIWCAIPYIRECLRDEDGKKRKEAERPYAYRTLM